MGGVSGSLVPTSRTETWPANTLSVDGFVARLFIGGTGEGPAIAHAPWLGRVLIALGNSRPRAVSANTDRPHAVPSRSRCGGGCALRGLDRPRRTAQPLALEPQRRPAPASRRPDPPRALQFRPPGRSRRRRAPLDPCARLALPITALPGSPVRSAAVLSLHFGGRFCLGLAAAMLRERSARTVAPVSIEVREGG